MFHETLTTLLKECTRYSGEVQWVAPWNTILCSLFPESEGFIMEHRYEPIQNSHEPLDIFEVFCCQPPSYARQSVLFLRFLAPRDWPEGISDVEAQLDYLTNISFTEKRAGKRVYYISAVGPHWRYGKKEEDGFVTPLIEWQETVHDEASYDHFQHLASLVRQLDYIYVR